MLALRFFALCLTLLVFMAAVPAQQKAQDEGQLALRLAIQLTREHRYSEAQAALNGVAAPASAAQKIAFYRLKAAIASGLEQFSVAAEDMNIAAQLAPENRDLRIAALVARLQAQVAAHERATATLKRLRSESLPPSQALDIRLRMARSWAAT